MSKINNLSNGIGILAILLMLLGVWVNIRRLSFIALYIAGACLVISLVTHTILKYKSSKPRD